MRVVLARAHSPAAPALARQQMPSTAATSHAFPRIVILQNYAHGRFEILILIQPGKHRCFLFANPPRSNSRHACLEPRTRLPCSCTRTSLSAALEAVKMIPSKCGRSCGSAGHEARGSWLKRLGEVRACGCGRMGRRGLPSGALKAAFILLKSIRWAAGGQLPRSDPTATARVTCMYS